MVDVDPGHIAAERPPRRGRLLLILAPVLAVIALVLAFLPIASFVAGLPALAAIVLAVVALVLGARRLLPALSTFVAVVALVIASVVSIGQFGRAVGGFAETLPQLDDPPSGAPLPTEPGDPDATEPPGSTGTLAAGEHRIVYEVLGEGSARVTYSAFLGGQSGTSSEDAVDVPHSRTQRVTIETGGAPGRFSMIASRVSGEGGALGCRISIDDEVVTERRPPSDGGVPLAVCSVDARG